MPWSGCISDRLPHGTPQATALLEWFDQRLGQQRQRILDTITEVFGEVDKDFTTLHNGIRRIVTEDVNSILQVQWLAAAPAPPTCPALRAVHAASVLLPPACAVR